jgi:uncharacterized protein involved in response to NO
MQVAALTRVFGPLARPDLYMLSIEVSGWFWIASFTVYISSYTLVLWQRRPDGRPA